MEMIEPTMLLVLALVAFVAGFIDAVAGGGGMLTVPALLSLGLPPHIALGTNKLAATFASSTAAFTYYKNACSNLSAGGARLQQRLSAQHWARSLSMPSVRIG